MKKIILFAFMAMSVSVMAQQVTPLSIEIAEVKIDSLRALYLAEPTMYRASLEVVAGNLNKNAEEIKQAKAVLKDEQSHAKEATNSIKQSAKMASSLKKLYSKEEAEIKSMQKVIEKQQKTLGKQRELNKETRDGYARFMERQQKELGYALREAAERQRAMSDLETAIQNGQTNLNKYIQEIEQKATRLAELEALLKQRQATVKAEQKAAKSIQ